MARSVKTGVRSDRPAASVAKLGVDRKELAATAFERTRMPIIIADPRQSDTPIVMANQAFLNLTGYSADEVVGRNCRFLQGKNTSPAVVAEMKTAVTEEREANIEILNYRKDGSAFWNQLNLSPIHNDDGDLVYYFGSQMDVTELREIQALKAAEHRLLLEVNHRANNVLAVVDSIVRLTHSADAKNFVTSVQERIQALAKAHALLADQGWTSVLIEQVICQQVEPFDFDQVMLLGPVLSIPAPVVQPLALVLHELAVNATAYGSLSVDTGKLEVEWWEIPNHRGFELQWKETGGPSPQAEREPGFGTIMAHAMIEKQLKGRISNEWLHTGLAVRISIPIKL